ETEVAGRRGVLQEKRNAKARAPPFHGKLSALAQAPSSVLHLITLLRQLLDAGIHGNETADLVADGLGVGEADSTRKLGTSARRHLDQVLPGGPALADAAAGDLGREKNAALGRGLRAAARLLVARLAGQEHGQLGGLHQHLAREHDVLVDTK